MPKLANIPTLLQELRSGRPIIVVDDENRENEGDLILPATMATPEKVAFIIRHTGGVVCLALTEPHAQVLQLPPMVAHNTAPRNTAYTVSVDAKENVTTGISAADRATTLLAATAPGATAEDLVRPGHVFPLTAKPGGVLRRAGHTEAAVDLARLAGFTPAAAISELMHDSGEMMRLPAIFEFAERHSLKTGTIAELIRYRLSLGQLYVLREDGAEADLPTPYGNFRVIGYRDSLTGVEYAALTMGNLEGSEPVLVRMHSECLTGDALHSLRCDCGFQRDLALQRIAEAGRGALVYLRQEGRGIGLVNKIKAYHLQDQGMDTVEANLSLGFPADLRDYGVGAQILADLRVGKIRLLTNNPRKIAALSGYGVEVVERVPLRAGDNKHNTRYLQTKKEKLGHLMD